jgi:nucleotide-binding universal stress UspA family protein
MYPWRRILIPTDFSTASEWSFDTAVDMAGSTGAELVILHVRSTWGSQPDKLRFPADDSLYSYVEQHELEKVRDHVRRANATIQTRLLVRKAPHAGEEISRAAKSEEIDLIVMATHARHHVAHLIIGSTTMQILHEPPTPVLAIRYGVPRLRALRRIVVPVHLRQTSTAAAELAAAIAKRDGAEVHLIIVCGDVERDAAETRVAEVERLFPTAPTRAIVSGKDIDREIVRYTDSSDADALFLNAGAHPLSDLKQEIIRQVSAPVMVVPSPSS